MFFTFFGRIERTIFSPETFLVYRHDKEFDIEYF